MGEGGEGGPGIVAEGPGGGGVGDGRGDARLLFIAELDDSVVVKLLLLGGMGHTLIPSSDNLSMG